MRRDRGIDGWSLQFFGLEFLGLQFVSLQFVSLQFLEAGDQALIGTVAFVALIFDRAQDGAKAVEKLKEPGDHDGAGRYFPFA